MYYNYHEKTVESLSTYNMKTEANNSAKNFKKYNSYYSRIYIQLRCCVVLLKRHMPANTDNKTW